MGSRRNDRTRESLWKHIDKTDQVVSAVGGVTGVVVQPEELVLSYCLDRWIVYNQHRHHNNACCMSRDQTLRAIASK